MIDDVSIEKKSCGKRTKLYIAYINKIIPNIIKYGIQPIETK